MKKFLCLCCFLFISFLSFSQNVSQDRVSTPQGTYIVIAGDTNWADTFLKILYSSYEQIVEYYSSTYQSANLPRSVVEAIANHVTREYSWQDYEIITFFRLDNLGTINGTAGYTMLIKNRNTYQVYFIGNV